MCNWFGCGSGHESRLHAGISLSPPPPWISSPHLLPDWRMGRPTTGPGRPAVLRAPTMPSSASTRISSTASLGCSRAGSTCQGAPGDWGRPVTRSGMCSWACRCCHAGLCPQAGASCLGSVPLEDACRTHNGVWPKLFRSRPGTLHHQGVDVADRLQGEGEHAGGGVLWGRGGAAQTAAWAAAPLLHRAP